MLTPPVTFRKNNIVSFEGEPVVECRFRHKATFEEFKEKIKEKVGEEGNEQEVVRIVYRRPYWVKDRVCWSTMDIKNDDDLKEMFEIDNEFGFASRLQLYVEHRTTDAEILRRLTPPSP